MLFAVVAVGVLCAVLTGFGRAMAALRGQVTPWLAPLVTLILIYGFLVIGVLVILPAVVVLLLVVNRRLHRVLVDVYPSTRPRWPDNADAARNALPEVRHLPQPADRMSSDEAPPPSNVVPRVGVTLHAGETDHVDVPNACK
jgi:hypothetical protein